MSRVNLAAKILRPLSPQTVLDVGCRDASLADLMPGVDYSGADLLPGPRVKYVGDITSMQIGNTFDAVVALDILEHLESPSEMFDRLVSFAERYLLISLPNTYDLKSRVKFVTRGQLGGKYVFGEEHPLDRHRWLMNRSEICAFAAEKARKHGLELQTFDLTYGSSGNRPLTAAAGRFASRILPRSLAAETVFALFTKPQVPAQD